MGMLTFIEMGNAIHDNAIAKGFAMKGVRRPTVDHIALQHSEVAEVLEEHRKWNDFNVHLGNTGKIEGVPSEFADIVIRILDYYTEYECLDILQNEIGFSSIEEFQIKAKSTYLIYDNQTSLIPYIVNRMHSALANAYEIHLESFSGQRIHHKIVVRICCYMANFIGFSLQEVIEQKMKYNTTREIKHGKNY